MATFKESISSRDGNNFHALRLICSLLVIITHSSVLLGISGPDSLARLTGNSFSTIGLTTFFFISGLFVTQSMLQSSSFRHYIWKRFLRVFPALWGVIFFCMFIVGPLLSQCALKDYFLDTYFWEYLKGITLIDVQYELPCVFKTNPFKNIVNGSLWTLPIEFKLYLILALAGYIGLVKRKWFILFLVLSAFLIRVFFLEYFENLLVDKLYWMVRIENYLNYGIYFGLGSLTYLFRDHIRINPLIAILLLIIWILLIGTDYRAYADYVVIPYVILSLAFIKPEKSQKSFQKVTILTGFISMPFRCSRRSFTFLEKM